MTLTQHTLIKRNFLQVTAAFLIGFRLDFLDCSGLESTTDLAIAAAASSTHKFEVEVEGASSSDSALEEDAEITEVGDEGGVEYTEPPADDNDSTDSGYSVRRTVLVTVTSLLDTHSSSTLK